MYHEGQKKNPDQFLMSFSVISFRYKASHTEHTQILCFCYVPGACMTGMPALEVIGQPQ